MSKFIAGKLDKEKLPHALRQFCPARTAHAITDIVPADLVQMGKKLVLLDVDNTLLHWRSEDIPESTFLWVQAARDAGLELCILSNTRHPERLERLSKKLNVPFLRGKFKPSRQMYLQALEKFQVSAEEAIMIGDQIFTDVWGSNRTQIDAILVAQMSPRDFVGTKVSRFGERLLRPRLNKAIIEVESMSKEGEGEVEDLALGGGAAFDLLKHPTVRQFVKFVIVGFSSTIIDKGIWGILMFVIPDGNGGLMSEQLGTNLMHAVPSIFEPLANKPDGGVAPALAASPIFSVIGTSIAIYNSFIWNRKWTFKIEGVEHRSLQLRKFFVVAIIGLILNALITSMFANVIPGHWKRSAGIAAIIATVIVAFWNFLGQKLWTFKKHS